MSYVSREIHTRQCCRTVFTAFRCHRPLDHLTEQNAGNAQITFFAAPCTRRSHTAARILYVLRVGGVELNANAKVSCDKAIAASASFTTKTNKHFVHSRSRRNLSPRLLSMNHATHTEEKTVARESPLYDL